MTGATVPASLDEALAALAADPGTDVVAGGTDLMVEVNFGHRRPRSLLALRGVAELRGVRHDGTRVWIGAGTTYRALETGLEGLVPALAQAARTVGSPQIRNAGTLGGNLATGSPAGDTLPVLLALDATVHCAREGGSRSLSLGEFLVGPKRTALTPGELVTGVSFDPAPGAQEFLKVGTRNAMVISIASVALVADPAAGTVRLALGSVGPTALRAVSGEAWIAAHVDLPAGRVDGDLEEFAAAVRSDARPIDDHRATAEYRRHAVGVCARRALERMVAP